MAGNALTYVRLLWKWGLGTEEPSPRSERRLFPGSDGYRFLLPAHLPTSCRYPLASKLTQAKRTEKY